MSLVGIIAGGDTGDFRNTNRKYLRNEGIKTTGYSVNQTSIVNANVKTPSDLQVVETVGSTDINEVIPMYYDLGKIYSEYVSPDRIFKANDIYTNGSVTGRCASLEELIAGFTIGESWEYYTNVYSNTLSNGFDIDLTVSVKIMRLDGTLVTVGSDTLNVVATSTTIKQATRFSGTGLGVVTQAGDRIITEFTIACNDDVGDISSNIYFPSNNSVFGVRVASTDQTDVSILNLSVS